jgi:hypothetical protein
MGAPLSTDADVRKRGRIDARAPGDVPSVVMRFRRLLAASSLASIVTIVTIGRERDARADTQKFALAMMHFNVQYVAGGMIGFWPKPDPRLDKNAEEIEDQIIRESFEPVLDLFLAHPTWATDVEMQGYMLDVIAERHPGVLEKLRTLTKAGRIDVASFHYSDQFFIAHAREDWSRSADLTRATFAKHDVPLGPSVFCQEGQAGMGMAAAMKEKGYQTLVWPKNLFSYQHEGLAPAPLYRFGDVTMITSNGLTWSDAASGNGLEVTWTFVDDGELLATGGLNPYFPDVFVTKPAAVAKYEAELADLEGKGYRIATVHTYVEAAKAVAPLADPPPLLDGTWQPGSTDGSSKWLGGSGRSIDERDDDVRTLATIAHRELVAAEAAASASGLDAKDDLDAAFRLLALGEVSDATGINPFRGEVEYGLAHLAEAARIARDVIVRAKAKSGAASVTIDAAAGTMIAGGTGPPEPTPLDPPPMDLVIESRDRTSTVKWATIDAGHRVVTITFGPGSEEALLSVRFPFASASAEIVYTPALTDTTVHFARDLFTFDHFHLALSDGLVGLGPETYVVQDQAFVHAAARIEKASGDLVFRDATGDASEPRTWVFHVLTGKGGDGPATSFARLLNVQPTVRR